MFKYTKTAIDIVIEDIKKICNVFKYSSMIFTFLYLGYALYSGVGNIIVNITLLVVFAFYVILDLFVNNEKLKSLKKFVRRSYKSVKLMNKGFTLVVMIYGVYIASANINGISIILCTLMIILWVLQLLFEIVIEIFDDKKDLIVAGWNKDIENLKKPATTVTNFIKKVKGEDIIEEYSSSKELKILEKRLNKNKKYK